MDKMKFILYVNTDVNTDGLVTNVVEAVVWFCFLFNYCILGATFLYGYFREEMELLG